MLKSISNQWVNNPEIEQENNSFLPAGDSVVFHYIIFCRLQPDFRRHPVPVHEEFPIYWNVPSFMCLKHGINFSDATQRFGIKANRGDQFRGDHVNILYDPGNFPAMLKVKSLLCLWSPENVKTVKGSKVKQAQREAAVALTSSLLVKERLGRTSKLRHIWCEGARPRGGPQSLGFCLRTSSHKSEHAVMKNAVNINHGCHGWSTESWFFWQLWLFEGQLFNCFFFSELMWENCEKKWRNPSRRKHNSAFGYHGKNYRSAHDQRLFR